MSSCGASVCSRVGSAARAGARASGRSARDVVREDFALLKEQVESDDFSVGDPSLFLEEWCTDAVVRDWLTRGVTWPLAAEAVAAGGAQRRSRDKEARLLSCFVRRLREGRVVEPADSVRVRNGLFLIVKPGKVRLIFNGVPANVALAPPPHFAMEGYPAVNALLPHHSWAAKFDIAHCFYHLRLSDELRELCGFEDDGELFRFARLPMGLSISPYVVTRVFDEVKRALRARGIVVTSFVDDFVIYGTSRAQVDADLDEALALMERWGFRIKDVKTERAAQQLEILGVDYDFAAKTVTLPRAKAEATAERVAEALAGRELARAAFDSVVGQLGFAAYFLPEGYTRLRTACRVPAFMTAVAITGAVRAELEWWQARLREPIFRRFRLLAETRLCYTDAAPGVVAFVERGWARNRTSDWLEEHIYVQEAEAIAWCLESTPPDTAVTLFSDNMACVGAFSKRSSPHPVVNALIARSMCLLHERGSTVRVLYVSTHDNPADFPSRVAVREGRWELPEHLFERAPVAPAE